MSDNQLPVIKLTINQSDSSVFGLPVSQRGTVSVFYPIEVWDSNGQVRYFTVREVIEKLLRED